MELHIAIYGEKLEKLVIFPYGISANDRLGYDSAGIRCELPFSRIYAVPSREGIFPGRIALLIVLAGRASAGLAY